MSTEERLSIQNELTIEYNELLKTEARIKREINDNISSLKSGFTFRHYDMGPNSEYANNVIDVGLILEKLNIVKDDNYILTFLGEVY